MEKKKMNLPNKLTVVRMVLFFPLLILIILYGVLVHKTGAPFTYELVGRIILGLILLVFIAAMITDYFDGKIARKNNITTPFGELWDPLADKVIVTTTLISLAVFKLVPVWMVIIFVCRDIIVDGARVVMAQNNVKVAASIWGKLKTLFQTFGIIIVLAVGISFDYFNEQSTYYNGKKWLYWVSFYVINLPLIVALFFSLFSCGKYFNSIKEHIKAS